MSSSWKFLLPAVFVCGLARADVRPLLEKAASVEQLLPRLPKELRENFTFVYASRSPHGGLGEESESAVTPLFPRVVLFTKDAREVLAFTGDPAKPGFDIVEIVRFDDAKRAFEFSRYVLPAAVAKHPGLAPLAKANGAINPPECLRCHGADPRPVTDSYPLWPGFYGSVRDTFPKKSPELPFYKKFLRTNAKHGVYRHLAWPKGTAVPPYLDPKHYNPNTIEGSLAEMKYLPNTRLGMALTELNRKRIQRKLEASPRYERYKYALLAGFLGCRLLPVDEAAVMATYADLTSESADRIQRLGTKPQGPNSTELDMMEIGFYGNVVQIAYLAQALDVSRRDWSMAFEDNSLSYFDGILSSIYQDKDFYLKEDFILEMLRDLAKKDPLFAPYFSTFVAYKDYGYPFGERLDFEPALKACELLLEREKKSGVTLPPMKAEAPALDAAGMTPATILKKLGQESLPFGRCVRCHEGVGALLTGRKIAFGSPAQLQAQLGKSAVSSERTLFEEILARVKTTGEGKMPPTGEQLTTDEATKLRRYLEAVRRL